MNSDHFLWHLLHKSWPSSCLYKWFLINISPDMISHGKHNLCQLNGLDTNTHTTMELSTMILHFDNVAIDYENDSRIYLFGNLKIKMVNALVKFAKFIEYPCWCLDFKHAVSVLLKELDMILNILLTWWIDCHQWLWLFRRKSIQLFMEFFLRFSFFFILLFALNTETAAYTLLREKFLEK